jgi:hypothetical protein
MKTSEDYLYGRNKELMEQLWAQERIAQSLQNEMTALLETFIAIDELSTLGKTKQIADLINITLKNFNYEK